MIRRYLEALPWWAILIWIVCGLALFLVSIQAGEHATETQSRYLLVYQEPTIWPDSGYGGMVPSISTRTEVIFFETIDQALAYLDSRKIQAIAGLWKVDGRVPVEMEWVEHVEPEMVKEKRWTGPQWRVKGE